MGHHGVRRIPKFGCGQGLSLGGNDLCSLFPFGFRLAGHGPVHALWKLDVLQLDKGHVDSPLRRGDVKDFAYSRVDDIRFGQDFIQGVLANHLAQRGLGDLVNGRIDIFNGDDRLDGVDDTKIGDRRNIDADIVPCDDALGLNGQGDDPHRYLGASCRLRG